MTVLPLRLLFLLVALALTASGCTEKAADYPDLIIQDIKEGNGPQVGSWDTVTVSYEGRLPGGKVFDSSRKKSKPPKYSMRGKTLIKGWRLGLIGMRVGGIRKLHIPSELAFGSGGKLGRFPPGATLEFEIKLLAID